MVGGAAIVGVDLDLSGGVPGGSGSIDGRVHATATHVQHEHGIGAAGGVTIGVGAGGDVCSGLKIAHAGVAMAPSAALGRNTPSVYMPCPYLLKGTPGCTAQHWSDCNHNLHAILVLNIAALRWPALKVFLSQRRVNGAGATWAVAAQIPGGCHSVMLNKHLYQQLCIIKAHAVGSSIAEQQGDWVETCRPAPNRHHPPGQHKK